MPKSAVIYACTIIAIGVAVLGCATVGWQCAHPEALVSCLGLAMLASTFKLKLPKLTGTLSPAFVFALVAVATRSWSETVWIAAISGIVQCLWRPKNRPTALQVAFNAAAMAIAGGISHAVAHGIPAGGTGDLLVTLGVAAIALLLSNTLMISGILYLVNEAPIYTIWRAVQLWAVPYYLAGGIVASIWARAQAVPNIGSTILAAASVYLLSFWYKQFSQVWLGQTQATQ